MSVLTLIPRHNSVIDQAYWYEIIIPGGVWIVLWDAMMILDLMIFTQMSSRLSIKLFLKLTLVSILTMTASVCIFYVFWSIILEYNHPMPLLGIPCSLIALFVSSVSIPFLSPHDVASENISSDKMKRYMFYGLVWILNFAIQRPVLSKIFTKLENTNGQCIMALLIPISKIFTKLLLSKMIHRIVEIRNERVNVVLTVTVNYFYGLFTATKLVGARSTTVICMIIVEFLMQMIMTYKIVKLHRYVNFEDYKKFMVNKRKAILNLVLAELCEGLVPLAYAISFIMAYYGANAELIGNVRNGYWQYKAVDDASWTLIMMFWLFAVDSVCLLLNSIIIWTCTKINIFKEFCLVLKKYWYILALKLVQNIYFDFFSNDVNLGVDFTFKFEWITTNQEIITNSTSTYI